MQRRQHNSSECIFLHKTSSESFPSPISRKKRPISAIPYYKAISGDDGEASNITGVGKTHLLLLDTFHAVSRGGENEGALLGARFLYIRTLCVTILRGERSIFSTNVQPGTT